MGHLRHDETTAADGHDAGAAPLPVTPLPVTPLTGLALARAATDRAAHLRAADHVAAALAPGGAGRVLEVAGGRVPARDGALVLREPVPGDAERLGLFLGQDAEGTSYVAVVQDEPGEDWTGLRELGGLVDDRDAGLLTAAVALANWHAAHPRCPLCGRPTVPATAGWSRRCPADGSEHHPRTDPAVIMAVVDADDRLLLGRGASWPEGRFSTLAGFVEPGETLEAAVRREVAEEAGIRVGEVRYRGSQPWPFPASLMLGFTARAESTDIAIDGAEIAEAHWFTREGYRQALESGDVITPTGISIARALIEDWYGEPITAPGTWR